MKFFNKCAILIVAAVLIGCSPMTDSTETNFYEPQYKEKTALITVNDSEFIVKVNETDFTDSFVIDYCKKNYAVGEDISCIEFIDEERNIFRGGSYEQCSKCYYTEISDKWDTHLHWINLFTFKSCTRRTRVCQCLICGKKVTTVAHLY